MPQPAPARNLPARPLRTARRSRTRRRLLAVTSLGLAGLVAGLLTGCGAGTLSTGSSAPNSYTAASGNWQFSSTSGVAARLSSLGGSLAFSGSAVTGILHPLSTSSSQCLPTSTALAVSGSVDTAGRLSLSAPLAGGTLTLSGTLAEDRKSLSAAAYTVAGGACAFPASQSSSQSAVFAKDAGSPVTAQQYQPVSGTYAGTLTTADGEHFNLTSTLTQTSQPDADGIYHVSGTASSPGNTCVPASLPATASAIAGGSISTTWTDPVTGATITGTGASSPDGSSISISNWTITSACGSDTGTGTLIRQ